MGTRVYIGGLPHRVRERDVERFFRGYGKLREVLIKNGYGFVEFDDHRDADDAVYELNGKDLCGERVTVERARGAPRSRGRGPPSGRSPRSNRDYGGRSNGHRSPRSGRGEKYGPPTRTDYRLIVENLSSRVSWQDLKDYMRQAGEVTYADAHKQHRNEGVVEFASSADLKNAIEKLDDTELNGRRIRLVEDKETRRSRRHSRSSSRSRSRSRSHRRSRSRSRSKSRSKSRSRSKSKSKSRSVSKSRNSKDKDARSPSRGRSADRDGSRDRSKSPARRDRSKSPARRDRDSRSRSKSPAKSRSRSKSRGNSRSRSPRSRSRSPRASRSPSRSRSRSRQRDDVDMENGDRARSHDRDD